MGIEERLIDNLKNTASESIIENKIILKDRLINIFIDNGLSRRLAIEIGSLIKINNIPNPSSKLINELSRVGVSMITKLQDRGYNEDEILIILKNSYLGE